MGTSNALILDRPRPVDNAPVYNPSYRRDSVNRSRTISALKMAHRNRMQPTGLVVPPKARRMPPRRGLTS
jgi:hypothetical protein